jgi:hypothetical protein
MRDLTEFELQAMAINERLAPIATQPIDTSDPNWATLFGQRPHPLDQADVRPATETLLESLVSEYQNSDEETRKAIRDLFTSYRHFAWAASFAFPPTTEEAFRRHLILFSMQDQGHDSRDALLFLQELCEEARARGVITAPILAEVAQLSSDENRYGMGSVKSFIKRRIPK